MILMKIIWYYSFDTHNHLLLNSMSFVDGGRYCNTYNNIQIMCNILDRICKGNNLSILKINRIRIFPELVIFVGVL